MAVSDKDNPINVFDMYSGGIIRTDVHSISDIMQRIDHIEDRLDHIEERRGYKLGDRGD